VGGTTMGRRSGEGTGQEEACESEGDVPGRVSRYGPDERRLGRTMQTAMPHLFSIVASSFWRVGLWRGRR